jgi:hypothetical protein
MKPMEKMCDNCPFGSSKAQRHMRNSLRPGRFNEICQSIWRGFVFACHKTTTHDDDDEYIPNERNRECAGAIAFLERAVANRNRAESRGVCERSR